MTRLFFFLILFSFPTFSQNNFYKQRDYWPTKDWRTVTPEDVGMNSEKLKLLENYAFERTGTEENRKGIRTDAIVIIKNGYLVYEKYARGYDKNRVHLSWSVSKCFVNTLYGIAEKEGLIHREEFAFKYFDTLATKDKDKIKIKDLLEMSSGLDWNEGYEFNPVNSSVIQMLYTIGRKDMASYVAKRDLKYVPGTRLYYSSGDSNLLMGILKNKLNNNYKSFIWKNLFEKIGMNSVVWERDASGTFIGSSYLYSTPRDFAKFGFLYLNGGKWHNDEIFTKDWMDYTLTPARAYMQRGKFNFWTPNMSAHWYLFSRDDKWSFTKLMTSKKIPEDSLGCSGHWGQKIWVIPSLDLVVVYLSDNRGLGFSSGKFMEMILDSIENSK